MKRFRPVWNLVVGVPFMISSPFYSCHLVHHATNKFGTSVDPQYLHIKGNPVAVMMFVLMRAVTSSLLLPVRTLVLVPLSLAITPLRELLEEKFSSIAEPHYVAKFSDEDKEILLVNDLLSFLFWGAVLLMVFLGYISIWTPIALIGVLFGVMLINAFRILGEHTYDQQRYDAEENAQMREFLNSYNYTRGGILIELLYNTGFRYHALHHYLPQIPYHNMSKAHRILIEQLDPGSLYHSVAAKGHMANVMHLMKHE